MSNITSTKYQNKKGLNYIGKSIKLKCKPIKKNIDEAHRKLKNKTTGDIETCIDIDDELEIQIIMMNYQRN